MAEFCAYESHGGLCRKTGTYCNLGSCPYEELKEFALVVHGKWEEADSYTLKDGGLLRAPGGALRCSVCANAFDKKLLWKENFCPNCGARMDSAEMKEQTKEDNNNG